MPGLASLMDIFREVLLMDLRSASRAIYGN
jgi:hypothetical protein